MRRLKIWFATLFAISLAASSHAQELPSDLALVPGDSVGFVHIQVSDLWKHEMMKTYREVIQNAGPKAIAAFEKQMYPLPSQIQRVSMALLPPKSPQEAPTLVAIVRFSVAFDLDKAVKLHAPKAKSAPVKGVMAYVDPASGLGAYLKDEKTLVIGEASHVAEFMQRPPVPRGAITPAVEMAAKGMGIVSMLSVKSLPITERVWSQIPENVRPLLRADSLSMTMDLKNPEAVMTLRARYTDEKAVVDAETAMKDAIKIAKVSLGQFRQKFESELFERENDGPRPVKELPELTGALAGLGLLNTVNRYLDTPPLKRDGNELVMNMTLPKESFKLGALAPSSLAIGVGLLLPAVQKVREAAARANSQNNLKQIGLAMHNFHDAMGYMPQNITDKNGKALLSWRVQILPYIEQAELYRQFKLDEAWDSEHNRKLIEKMPKIYMVANAKNQEPDKTFYQGFVSAKGVQPRAMFSDDPKLRTRLVDITDGTSNSIMVVEAANAVEWTKPSDLPFDPKKELPKLGGHSTTGYNVLFGDGSVRFFASTIEKITLIAAITINGGEVVQIP